MKQRRIVGDILIALTVAFMAYLSVIMVYRINTVVLSSNAAMMFAAELIICVFFLLFALDIRFGLLTKMKSRIGKAIGWIVRIFVIFIVAVVLFLTVKICAGCFINTAAPVENVIVLGNALENSKPTQDLLLRLDTAAKYLEENPGSVAILTGGNPDESGLTEAAVMHDILLVRGITEDRMILEDKADTTVTNFKNTAMLIGTNEPIVIVTSNYHMDRAVQTAENAGFSNILRLPAPSSVITFGPNLMAEVVAELGGLLIKQ